MREVMEVCLRQRNVEMGERWGGMEFSLYGKEWGVMVEGIPGLDPGSNG